ncbi:MAG: cytochrome c biogenesis protein CcdA [Bacillota bacterium]|nr:cytochrome c biogenesis protein CcdA [Bacillota bacterium]
MLDLNIVNTPGVYQSFIAGLLSFLSPCLLPLIPIYVMYLKTGSENPEDIPTDPAALELYRKAKFRRGLIKALQFVLGFTIVFMLLGLAASSVGKFLIQYRDIITRIAGAFIIFFGLTMLGVVRINMLTKDYRRMRGASAIGMGMAFAFGWTPCLGPILGSILAMTAAVTSNLTQGIFLLFVYSLGLAIPFILAYVFIEMFEKHVSGIAKYSNTVAKVGAVIMILFGLILLFNQLNTIIGWLS